MDDKNKSNAIISTLFFKWGLTAFLVVVASVTFVYSIYNMGTLLKGFTKAVKVLTPIINGLVIAYLINPIMCFFETRVFEKPYIKNGLPLDIKKRKQFRLISLVLAFVIVIVFLYAFFSMVLPQIYSSIESIIVHFPTYYNNVIDTLNDVLEQTNFMVENDLTAVINNYSEDINKFLSTNILPSVSDLFKSVSNGVLSAVGAVLNLVIGIIIAIYLLFGKEKYIGIVKKVIYSVLDRERANNLMIDLRFVNRTFGGFLVGKIIDSIIIGILCFIGLKFLATPYAVLVSVIVGITNVIPFFGPYLGAIPSTLLILLVDPRQALYFIIFVLILQQVDGNIIGPAILGNSIGVSSFWIIVAITVFGGFFGILGMLVGVPIFACMYAFIRRKVNNRLNVRKLPLGTLVYSKADYINGENVIVPISDSLNEKTDTLSFKFLNSNIIKSIRDIIKKK